MFISIFNLAKNTILLLLSSSAKILLFIKFKILNNKFFLENEDDFIIEIDNKTILLNSWIKYWKKLMKLINTLISSNNFG